jgi:Tol biopolymer transport system component
VFNAPRWSPDGRSIAVERHVAGSLSAGSCRSRHACRSNRDTRRARFVTPAWKPGGGAPAAADLEEVRSTYEAAVAESPAPVLRALTRRSGGATWPDVSADGRRIVFVGYTADGSDLFEMPHPDAGGPATSG